MKTLFVDAVWAGWRGFHEYTGDGCNMTKKTLLAVIVLIGLALSGCTEHDIQTVNNTTDAHANTTNATANVSDGADSQSFSIPLEKPPFIEDQ